MQCITDLFFVSYNWMVSSVEHVLKLQTVLINKTVLFGRKHIWKMTYFGAGRPNFSMKSYNLMDVYIYLYECVYHNVFTIDALYSVPKE